LKVPKFVLISSSENLREEPPNVFLFS